jgi:hypothetical protein
MSTSERSFIRSPPTMQFSYLGLSLVTRAGFADMTLRQSNNPPNRKVKSSFKSMLILFFDIKGIVHE